MIDAPAFRVPTPLPLRAIVAAIAVASATGACAEGPTASGDATVPPVPLTMDNEYSGSLEAGQELSFFATGVPGNAMRVQFWAQSGRASDSLILTVRADSNGPVVGTLSSVGTQAALNDRVLHLQPQGVAQRYFMTLRGAAADDAGPFRIAFRAPGITPERAPTQLTVGDSVIIESLDSDYEIDRFEFMGDSGAQYMVAVSFLTARPGYTVFLQLTTPTGAELVRAPEVWDSKPLELFSRTVTLTQSGLHFVSIRPGAALGNVLPGPVFDGRYKLWLYRINPAPESRSGVITINDTIVDAIDYHGDFDTYTFQADSGEDLRLDAWFARAQSPPGVIEIFTTPRLGNPFIPLTQPRTRLDEIGTTFRVPSSGQHRIQVRGGFLGLRDSVTTPYRLELRRINRSPETTTAARALTDSVVGETIPRSGDIDEFTVQLAPGQIVAVRATATMTDTGSFAFELDNGDPSALQRTQLTDTVSTKTLSFEARLNPVTLKVRVRGNQSATGSFRLDFYPINRAPETVAATLPLNTFVTEPLAPFLDVDEFRFPTVAGRTYNILIQEVPGSTGGAFVLGSYPYLLVGFLGEGATGTFIAPATDSAAFRVYGELRGSYRLMAYEVDSMPESRSAAMSIGDTISGENILFPGDIDNFTFNATAGTRLRVRIDAVGGHPQFQPFVYVFEGSAVTTSVFTQSGTPAEFTAPSTGAYRIRVQAGNEKFLDRGAGSYRLSLVAIP